MATRTITTDPAITLAADDVVYRVAETRFQTTKNVSRVELGIAASLEGRTNEGEQRTHSLTMKLEITPDGGSTEHLAYLYMSNRVRAIIRRTIVIKNLNYDVYRVDLRVLTPDEIDDAFTIQSLEDTGVFSTINTGVILNSKEVQLDLEGTQVIVPADARNNGRKNDKDQLTSDNGPLGSVTVINEMVDPGDIGRVDIQYPNDSTAFVSIQVSQDIQNIPTARWFIKRGEKIPNLLAAGVCTATAGPGNCDDVNAHFESDGITTQSVVRNLTSRQQAAVTSVTETSLGTSITFSPGDRYVAWTEAASPYLPDVYTSRLSSPDGVGQRVDADRFIDYERMVRARQVCVYQQLYWEGTVDANSLEEWISEQATQSALFPSYINGRYGLIPECAEPIRGIFNASNVFDYRETWVPWNEQTANTMLVRFRDEDGRSRSIKVQTLDAYNGVEIEDIRPLQLDSVTRLQQAMRIGATALNSLRLQSRVLGFKTDVEAVDYVPGDLIRGQHTMTEYDSERSGIVISVMQAVDAGTSVKLIAGSIVSVSAAATSGYTLFVMDCPHGIKETDINVIISAGNPTYQGVYTDFQVWDLTRFAVAVTFTVEDKGGQILRSFNAYNQVVTVGESVGLTSGSDRVSVMHRSTREVEVDLLVDTVVADGFRVTGIEVPLVTGDYFSVGDPVEYETTWRVQSLNPAPARNEVEINAVLWTQDLFDFTDIRAVDNTLSVIPFQ